MTLSPLNLNPCVTGNLTMGITTCNAVHYNHYKGQDDFVFQEIKPLTKYFPSGETLQSWLDCLKTSEKFISRA